MSIAPFYEKTAVMTTDDPEMQTKNDFIGTGDAIKSTAADISTVLDEKLNEFGQKLQPTVNKFEEKFTTAVNVFKLLLTHVNTDKWDDIVQDALSQPPDEQD